MNIKRVAAVYFSPTGTTLKVHDLPPLPEELPLTRHSGCRGKVAFLSAKI